MVSSLSVAISTGASVAVTASMAKVQGSGELPTAFNIADSSRELSSGLSK